MKIAILTSPNQWFVPYSQTLKNKIKNSDLYFDHKDITKCYDIIFILSYHKILQKEYLQEHKHNIVIHGSALPKGKGWSPVFWQILEGKNKIPFSMFEASEDVDNGNIYMQKDLLLSGYELNNELRDKQAVHTINMCLDFLENYETLKIPREQKGKETFYEKRTAQDSELNLDKTIREQFNLFRIVDNENYPAFFYKDNTKYILKIEKAEDENR